MDKVIYDSCAEAISDEILFTDEISGLPEDVLSAQDWSSAARWVGDLIRGRAAPSYTMRDTRLSCTNP